MGRMLQRNLMVLAGTVEKLVIIVTNVQNQRSKKPRKVQENQKNLKAVLMQLAAKKDADSKSDGTWVAVDSEDESMMSIWDDIPTTDDGWFSDNDDNVSDIGDEGYSLCDLPEELFIAIEPTKCGKYSYVQAKLYDSGYTTHILPY